MPITKGAEQKEGTGPDYQTIAVMRVGDTSYLIRANNRGKVVFQSVSSNLQKDQYQTETRSLPQEAFVAFDGVDASKVTIANVGLSPTSIRWVDRANGVSEPVISIPTIDAVKNAPAKIEMSGRELQDLFLEEQPGGKEDVAAFFTIPTLTEDMIFIVLRRPYPVILNIAPANDGIDMTPIAGLQSVLSGIYDNLTTKMTPLQMTVDNRVRIAMEAQNGPIKFKTPDNTPPLSRQREIQKAIYKIEALLLAANAEASGAGLKDKALLAHAPFLPDVDEHKTTNGSSGGISLFGRAIFGSAEVSASINFARGHEVTIDNSLWAELLAKPGTGFLLGGKDNTPPSPSRITATPTLTTPLGKPAVARPAPKPVESPKQVQIPEALPKSAIPDAKPATPVAKTVSTRPDIKSAGSPSLTKAPLRGESQLNPPSGKRDEVKPIQKTWSPEKSEAISLAQEIITSVDEILDSYSLSNADPSLAGKREAEYVDEQLLLINDAIDNYLSKRPQSRTVSGKPIFLVQPSNHTVNIAGIEDDKVFAFLTGYGNLDYKKKIDQALSAWGSIIYPVFQIATSQMDRSLGTLATTGKVRNSNPAAANSLISAIREAIKGNGQISGSENNIDAAVLGHLLINGQILYSVKVAYETLENQGEAEEIDSWANYSKQTVSKLRELKTKANIRF